MPFRYYTDETELRRGWRRLARSLHPDANTHDPQAEDRFKVAHSSYRAALKRLRRGIARRAAPPSAPRSRWVCPACDDTFTYGEQCPRCLVALHDAERGATPSHQDPAVDAFIVSLQTPRREFDLPIAPEHRPMLSAMLMLCFGMTHWHIGLYGSAVLFFGFALFVTMLDGHDRLRRWRPEAWKRL